MGLCKLRIAATAQLGLAKVLRLRNIYMHSNISGI